MTETNWGDAEMKSLKLGDERLEKRARKIISDFSQNPTGSILEFCGDRAATQAAYNFFSHQRTHGPSRRPNAKPR